MSLISGQGTRFYWGTAEFLLTSVSWQAGSGGGNEIDITSMSSTVIQDSLNSGKNLIKRDIDSAYSGAGDVSLSVEFLLDSDMVVQGNSHEAVGLKRDLRLDVPADDRGTGVGLSIRSKAVLTQMSLGVSTGEFVSGSATFKLSGD